MREKLGRSWDLVGIIVASLLLVLAIALVPDSLVRTIIGLPFLLFFPGYVLIATLMPEKEELDVIERVALSFGLSIAVTPLIGLGLNYTPWGIRLEPILFSITAFNVLLSGAAFYRREKVEDPYLPFELSKTFSNLATEFRKEKGLDRALTIILIVAIISSVVSLGYVVAFPKDGEKFSEFYILGPEGMASNYPTDLGVNEDGTLIIGVVNHEHRTVNYTIELWLTEVDFIDNQTVVHHMYWFDSMKVELEHVDVDIEGDWTPQWEMLYTFSVPQAGQYKLFFLLYADEAPALPSEPSFMMDFNDSEAEQRIIGAVNNDVQSLNLNIVVTV